MINFEEFVTGIFNFLHLCNFRDSFIWSICLVAIDHKEKDDGCIFLTECIAVGNCLKKRNGRLLKDRRKVGG